jgi:hypothetical protein
MSNRHLVGAAKWGQLLSTDIAYGSADLFLYALSLTRPPHALVYSRRKGVNQLNAPALHFARPPTSRLRRACLPTQLYMFGIRTAHPSGGAPNDPILDACFHLHGTFRKR